MRALSSVGVLVTRPERQAHDLCRLIEAQGGTALRFPALEIRAAADLDAMRAAVGSGEPCRLVIFVSANAVRFGATLLAGPGHPLIAAIGRATAAALAAAGHPASLLPRAGYDSEALLAHPELHDMAGQHVLIVRGRGGRELLGDTLAARGAVVRYAEVYERRAASPSPESLARLQRAWKAGNVDAYTATSSELLEALLGILPPDCRTQLDRTALLTGAGRVVERARQLGLGSPVVLAAAPDDAALVDALIAWHAARRPEPLR